jgi:hypothetical protein
VQVVLQAVPAALQVRLPGQLAGVTVLHVPAPSQVAAGVSTDPAQLPAAHCVLLGQSRQCPAPSHSPSVRHPEAAVVVHWVVGLGACPAGTGEQVPAVPLSAHDMQVPVQAVLQQTPWAQNPDPQEADVVHAAPGGSLPQLPALHTLGETQSLLAVQVDLQAPFEPHIQGSQGEVVTVLQVPAPSQLRAGVSVDPVQEAAAQLVPAG